MKRTAERVVMTPAWHHLLFLHWEVAPDTVRRLLPAGLEPDLFEGRAYVGLIPFTMTQVRPHAALRLVPGRYRHENFHEINVRTYVRRHGRDPGVWFWSLDAASAPAVIAARAWFKLPYFHARMSLRKRNGHLEYSSHRLWPRPLPASCHVRYTPLGTPTTAQTGTLEHFLIERYLLYSRARGQLFQGRVAHHPYQIQEATLHTLHENYLAAAGIPRPDSAPLVHYARGVRTKIYSIERAPE